MPCTEKAEKITKSNENITEIKDFIAKTDESFTKGISLKHQKLVDKFMIDARLNRIIKYGGGGLGIERKVDNSFETYYFNKEGEQDFVISKQLPVLPWDKIIFHKSQDILDTEIQTEKLLKLCGSQEKVKRIIKRKGEFNVLVETGDKVISILPNGWTLDFETVDNVDCVDNEVINDFTKAEIGIAELQQKVKLHDYVEAKYSNGLIQGEIVHIYGLCDAILNINFDNNTKQTAIGRYAITKVLKSA